MKSSTLLYSAKPDDEKYTPRYAVRALIPHLLDFYNPVIWCPFDDRNSAFVEVLHRHVGAGFSVVYSHINTGQDFFSWEPPQWDIMISNPPFTGTAKIFRRALDLGKPFALIGNVARLNDKNPKALFAPLQMQLLLFEERVLFRGCGKKITFSSCYFACDMLKSDLIVDRLEKYGKGVDEP